MSFITQGKTNWKFLLIVVVLAAVVGGGVLILEKELSISPPEILWISLHSNDQTTSTICENCGENAADIEKSCIESGGIVATSSCCLSSTDFPNSCFINSCVCQGADSKEVKICDCGKGKCFNGKECITPENKLNTNNWETYRNEGYGFEIKYPEDYIYSKNNNSIEFSGDDYRNISFNFEKKPADSLDLDSYVKSIVSDWSDWSTKNLIIQKEILGNNKTNIIMRKLYETWDTQVYFYTENGDYFVEIYFENWGGQRSDQERLDVYNLTRQMISTMKYFQADKSLRKFSDKNAGFEIKDPFGYILRTEPINDFYYQGNNYWGENLGGSGVGELTSYYSKTLGVIYMENPELSYPQTDLVNAFITIGTVDAESKDKCNTYYYNSYYYEQSTGTEMIGNVVFSKADGGGAAMGNFSSSIYHTIYIDGTCYALSENVHTYTHIIGYGITAVDEEKVFSELHNILFTFRFLE